MRSSNRLLATVKSAAKYLEANTPTGLTGLPTHPAPRPALIYTYRQTLTKLGQLPASSVYRQSAEALTKHRLKIVEETTPEGFEAWQERVKKQIDASPAYNKYKKSDGSLGYEKIYEDIPVTWDGEVRRGDARQEGSNNMAEADRKATLIKTEVEHVEKAAAEGDEPTVDDLEVEPALTVEQYEIRLRTGGSQTLTTTNRINAIEHKIGAGLIEEVLQVAEGELELVDQMLRSQV